MARRTFLSSGTLAFLSCSDYTMQCRFVDLLSMLLLDAILSNSITTLPPFSRLRFPRLVFSCAKHKQVVDGGGTGCCHGLFSDNPCHVRISAPSMRTLQFFHATPLTHV